MAKKLDLPPLADRASVLELNVDLTPDDGLPVRILEAYCLRARTKWAVSGLDERARKFFEIMNQHQDERAAILEKAIRQLKRGGTD
jgi:hypothetical protein